eukprot:CAMPEP_0172585074 /NCGR_PEP_ID=MMETSP1068-20121228/4546_1 /TAXON_ID=35684 /ORGANISM="Pseudopedinella elastica, Strain CCMP716" /LENGTH=568 /DNA_ID=CAMNT_0013379417 /DNA_START=188 /DNA_END=1895 /DNA_ORIENTATION=-
MATTTERGLTDRDIVDSTQQLESNIRDSEALLGSLVMDATAQQAALKLSRMPPQGSTSRAPEPPLGARVGARLGGPTGTKPHSTETVYPGFAGHIILALNDSQFRVTPVDELMSQYGRAQGGGSCEGDFGMGLIARWRATRKPCCLARSGSDSSLECHLVKQTKHHGHGDQLVLGTNVRVDYKDWATKAVTDKVLKDYIGTKHSDAAYVHMSKGALAATCETDPSEWKKAAFPGWNEDWFKSLDTGRAEDTDLGCDHWEEQPTLLLQRDTFANFFHDSEDFFNTFIALAVLKWPTDDLQVIITDLYPKGPFWDMWSRVFAGRRAPLTAWDLKTKYGKQSRVCYRKLALGIYGPASPITVASWRTPCSRTPLVRAYSDYVVRGLGLEGRTHYAQPSGPPRVVTITYMARRASSQWPERRFCDSKQSFFKCEDWMHLDKRSLGRMIRNDKQVVAALKELETRRWTNGAQVTFRDVDFNLLSFEEQIAVDITTDVMVGPHGAGLMHNIFMPDRGVLVELHIDNSGSNQHFHNLARWQGRKYLTQNMGNPINTNELKRLVASAVESIDINTY